MVRQTLIHSLSEAFPGIAQQDMLMIVESLFETMARALIQGETVEIRGLGRFTVKERRPARGRNPRTAAPVDLPKRWVVRFKPAESLIKRLNFSQSRP